MAVSLSLDRVGGGVPPGDLTLPAGHITICDAGVRGRCQLPTPGSSEGKGTKLPARRTVGAQIADGDRVTALHMV